MKKLKMCCEWIQGKFIVNSKKVNYKIFILVLISIFYSCQDRRINNSSREKQSSHILNYYKISKDKTQSISDRKYAINKAYKLLAKQSKDTLYCKVLYQKGVIHYSKKEFDSLWFYANILWTQANTIENYYYQGKANYLKGYYLDKIRFIRDSAFYYYNRSKNNFLVLQDSSEVGRRLLNMAYIQKNSSDFFGSKETITNALRYLIPEKDKKYIASAYNVLAINNKYLLNKEDAIKYYKKAIVSTQSNIDQLIYTNNLSVMYIQTEEYGKAIVSFRNILKDSLIYTVPKERARVLDNLAYAQWRKDSIDVEHEFLKALDVRITEHDQSGLIASYTHLGEYFMHKDKDKAKSWFQKAIRTAKAIKNPRGELDALQFLMSTYPNDLITKDRFIVLNDSLQKQELKVKTQFAKIQYDDQLKIEEILKLEDIMKQQQLEVSIQRTQKIIYLLVGILLLVTIAFFGHYLIRKHRKEKEKEVYKTEKRISKKIHDELANDISNLASYVEKTAEASMPSTKEVLGNKLQNMYLRARDISIETATIDVDNFKKELLNLIQQYNTNAVRVITNLSEIEWTTTPDYKKIAVYRVLQELFVNAKKHSDCKRITLIARDSEKKRVITYTDDGVGCNISTVKTNGLVNAENRIDNIKGKLTFETSSGEGFRATIVF
ncbi:hypothetical protein [uncultured Aquimarina sp.]|uniref:tetratricopeptide repeat-containing sensor histidine kinase n=1 Tax=uncultured Aquimarina sp. TaxID=575652 RepID=UPI0026236081|nr:hypothetical protein [uncultured Aquimarina sp.]